MNKNSTLLAAVILAGTVGVTANSSWSQQTPGETRQSQPGQSQPEQAQPWQSPTERSQPGAAEGIPGMHGAGTQELSKSDMQAVQQVLKQKGYDVSMDGTADNSTRAAIRKFQEDEGLPVTGIIDEPTANRLGFQMRSQSPSGTSQPGSSEVPGQPGYPGSTHQPGSSGVPGSTDRPGSSGMPGSTGQPGSTEQPSHR